MRLHHVFNFCCSNPQPYNFSNRIPAAARPSLFPKCFLPPLPLRGQCFVRGPVRASQEPSDHVDGSSSAKGAAHDPDLMDAEERREWRRKIKQVIDQNPDVQEEDDPDQKRAKMQNLIADYPLVVEEEDPNWIDADDGWGFNLGQFFDKITINNNKDDADDNDDEIVWKDDNYIKPIKDIKTADWEETVFKDISPLIILVHNRYKRPKDNEKVRDELVKAVQIIWNCRLPSPRCVAVDAVVETDLVSALEVAIFPEIIFTKSGMILHREKGVGTADEYSKMMAYFYYGAAKPACLSEAKESKQLIPSISIRK